MKKQYLFAGSAIFGLLGFQPALASAQQQAPESRISNDLPDAIIVTARKREKSLLDTPIAISVFSSENIKDAGYENLGDITKASPGVFLESFNLTAARVDSTPRFRGIFLASGDRLQQTASVFVDGIFVSGSADSLDLADLQRVEIIKGPQSALFGRNTFAGAINYVTKDPAYDLGGEISVLAATRDEYKLTAMIEGPIVADALRGRLSGSV